MLWALVVLSHVSIYRQSHNLLVSDTIFLFLDGHGSHASPIALQIFAQANIQVITLLAHTSHVCQMFDLVLASPLSYHFHKIFQNELNEAHKLTSNSSAAQRIATAKATIKAWREVATVENCQKSGQMAGLMSRTDDYLEIF